MVAEKQNRPEHEVDDPRMQPVEDDDGGIPQETIDSEHNEPGSQQPPSGDAVPDDLDDDTD